MTLHDTRKENFPIDAFQHLERRLGEVRHLVMERSAEIANARTPVNEPVYRVTEADVRAAYLDVFSNPDSIPWSPPLGSFEKGTDREFGKLATPARRVPDRSPDRELDAIAALFAHDRHAHALMRYASSCGAPVEIAFVGAQSSSSTKLNWYSLAVGPEGLLIAAATKNHKIIEEYRPVTTAEIELFNLDRQSISGQIERAHSATSVRRWLRRTFA